MKKYFFQFVTLCFCFGILVPTLALAQTEENSSISGERIMSYDTTIHINKDATIDVLEKIVYDFGTNKKHGIFRNIPLPFKANNKNVTLKISDVRVEDVPFTVSKQSKNFQIKIGDPNVLVSGVVTYTINYKVDKAVGYFDAFDELYWNATGANWTVPMGEVHTKIVLPESVTKENLRIACYEGPNGSNNPCGKFQTDSEQEIRSVDFWVSQPLGPGQGLTAALGFPKGMVKEPGASENILDFIEKYWTFVLPVAVFFIMLRLWFKKGKDPKGMGIVVAEYDVPDNLTPLEMSLVLNQSIKNRDISAEIIFLAVKGYLKIDQVTEKVLFFNQTDYILTLLKNPDDLSEFDKSLIEALFVSKESGSFVRLSELKKRNQFRVEMMALRKLVVKSVVEKGYYPSDPQKVILKYVGVSFIFFFITFLFGIASAIAGVIIVIFSLFMPAVTKQGALMREKIKGLKLYITVAEKDRINFHNAPEKKPEFFEKLLPYAMALGVEGAWAKQFEGIYLEPPQWYHGTHGAGFNALVFAHNLSSFSTVASSAFAGPSGGSGSGGGGFSGGGGGGGGGGSW